MFAGGSTAVSTSWSVMLVALRASEYPCPRPRPPFTIPARPSFYRILAMNWGGRLCASAISFVETVAPGPAFTRKVRASNAYSLSRVRCTGPGQTWRGTDCTGARKLLRAIELRRCSALRRASSMA